MKKILALALVAAFVVSGGLVGCSSPTSAPATTPDKKDKETTAEGKFIKADGDKLTIKVGDKDTDFTVKDVKAMTDGKEVKWEDVKKDAIVIVTSKDGKVTKVEVKK